MWMLIGAPDTIPIFVSCKVWFLSISLFFAKFDFDQTSLFTMSLTADQFRAYKKIADLLSHYPITKDSALCMADDVRLAFAESLAKATKSAKYVVVLCAFLHDRSHRSDRYILGQFQEAIHQHQELANIINELL
jgi:hypothetical protein